MQLIRWKQLLRRSLLSGSEASLSKGLSSNGGSYLPSPHLRPPMLCSATDAASAAIDFSKGNVEEGAVNSLPSRGPGKTPICSPSLLKRIAYTPSQMHLQSPTRRADMTTHRKLYAEEEDVPGELLDHGGQTQGEKLYCEEQSGDTNPDFSKGECKKMSLGVFKASRMQRLLSMGTSKSPISMEIGSLPSIIASPCRTVQQELRELKKSQSLAIADLYISNVNRSLTKRLPQRTPSLSTDGISQSEHKRQKKVQGTKYVGDRWSHPYYE